MRRCTRDGCDDKHEARGLCRRHYQKLMRRGLPPLDTRRCTIDGCHDPVRSRNLCHAHYMRWIRHFRDGGVDRDVCEVEGCDTAALGRGRYCIAHFYSRIADVGGDRRVSRPPCGTSEGRESHRRRGEPSCVKCERSNWSWIDVMLEAA